MLKLVNKIAIAIAVFILASSANAAQTLKIEKNSGGELKVEMYYSSAVTGKAPEIFNSAANGIIDCDMSGGAYQTSENAAFQFAGDIMGGYETPYQMYDWLNSGGRDALNNLYNKYGMQFVGWWIPGMESLISSKPLPNIASLKNFKFRSPPGMETEIFAELGAKPIVMDFGEVPTALQTGIIDGADFSNLANNTASGLYDTNPHATYPGFHSMPADHLACNKAMWDKLSKKNQDAILKAIGDAGAAVTKYVEVKNVEAVKEMKAKNVTLHDLSKADRLTFRQAAQKAWADWSKKTPEAKVLVDSHVAYMKKIGLLK